MSKTDDDDGLVSPNPKRVSSVLLKGGHQMVELEPPLKTKQIRGESKAYGRDWEEAQKGFPRDEGSVAFDKRFVCKIRFGLHCFGVW